MLFTDVLDNAEDKDLWKKHGYWSLWAKKKKWVKTWKYKMNLKNFVSPAYKEVLKKQTVMRVCQRDTEANWTSQWQKLDQFEQQHKNKIDYKLMYKMNVHKPILI